MQIEYNPQRKWWKNGFGCPWIQFTKNCGIVFNEGGKVLTLSIFGTSLFFRLWFHIPFTSEDMEIMVRRSI